MRSGRQRFCAESRVLDLYNADITGNHASNGGGIYTAGSVPGLTLALHAGTTVESNTAGNDGGDILSTGETFLYATEGGVVVSNDSAGVHGGGIGVDGTGNLTPGNVRILGNLAGYGDGINAHGNGGHVESIWMPAPRLSVTPQHTMVVASRSRVIRNLLIDKEQTRPAMCRGMIMAGPAGYG